ncbi:MAG TPA: signal peptidase I [Conexibacter sp.]|nr:signal peptidase I [Conexibacter sp.]
MIWRLAANMAMVALFGIAAVMIVPAAFGFHRYVILTGSMTGTHDAGSIVFDKAVPTSSLKVHDVITYEPPPGASPNFSLVTHRIHRIERAPDGGRVFQTKGDFNATPDPWRFVLPKPTQDKVIFSIPYVGFAFEFLSEPRYRKLVIGLPAILVAMWALAGLWKEGGEAQRRRERGVEPWSDDVARRLPQLAPVDGASADATAAVPRLAVVWPQPAHSRRRAAGASSRGGRSAPAVPALGGRSDSAVPGPAAPALHAAAARAGGAGRPRREHVALPPACFARTRGRRAADARTLPADWRLVVRRRMHGPDTPA